MDDLHLPKTKLLLSDGVLKKLGKDDTMIATFPMESIKDIRCEKYTEYTISAIFIIMSLALGVIAKLFIPSPGWGWTAVVICSGVTLFSIMMIFGTRVVLETDGGIVSYSVVDTSEEAVGFVALIKQKL